MECSHLLRLLSFWNYWTAAEQTRGGGGVVCVCLSKQNITIMFYSIVVFMETHIIMAKNQLRSYGKVLKLQWQL